MLLFNQTFIISLWLFLLGSGFGSFLNVVIDRTANNKSILGRSQCDSCEHILKWYELVPVFSYFFIKGKCSYCKKSLSIQYPLVEFLAGLLFILPYAFTQTLNFQIFIVSLMLYFAFAIFITDIKYMHIPQWAIVSLFILSLFIDSSEIIQKTIFALSISAVMWVIYSLTKQKAFGFGDIQYMFVIALILSLNNAVLAFYSAVIIGGAFSVFLLIAKKATGKTAIAFGPFLSIGLAIGIFMQFLY